MGYGTGEMAPGGKNLATDPYTAGHNVLLSHAEAYHRYTDVYKASQQGEHSKARYCCTRKRTTVSTTPTKRPGKVSNPQRVPER